MLTYWEEGRKGGRKGTVSVGTTILTPPAPLSTLWVWMWAGQTLPCGPERRAPPHSPALPSQTDTSPALSCSAFTNRYQTLPRHPLLSALLCSFHNCFSALSCPALPFSVLPCSALTSSFLSTHKHSPFWLCLDKQTQTLLCSVLSCSTLLLVEQKEPS